MTVAEGAGGVKRIAIGDASIEGVDAVVGLPNTFLSVYTHVYFPQSTQDQTKLLFEAPRPGGR